MLRFGEVTSANFKLENFSFVLPNSKFQSYSGLKAVNHPANYGGLQ